MKRAKSKAKKNSVLFNRFLKLTLGCFLTRFMRIKYETEGIEGLRPPYIVLSNHVNFWDPFMLSVGIKDSIYFVTSDVHFRGFLLKALLRMVNAIPKTKFLSDSSTIKSIIRIKSINGVIGIFPEGERNWDGNTMKLLYPTAKLVKNLKIPVVSVVIKGGCLSRPRWSKKSRRGNVVISYNVVLDYIDINKLSVERIYEILTESLNFSEYDWQSENNIKFIGKRMAEYLEIFLFICPHCNTIGGMESNQNQLKCKICNYTVNYDEYGYFSNNKLVYYSNPSQWNKWQMSYIKELVEDNFSDTEYVLFSDDNVNLSTGYRKEKLKSRTTGKLILYADKITYSSHDCTDIIFHVPDINGINVQANNNLEFYYKNTLYSIGFETKRISSYKWVETVRLMQGMIANKEQDDKKEIANV